MSNNYYYMTGPLPESSDNGQPLRTNNTVADNYNSIQNIDQIFSINTANTIRYSNAPIENNLTGRGQVIAVPKQEYPVGGYHASVLGQSQAQL